MKYIHLSLLLIAGAGVVEAQNARPYGKYVPTEISLSIGDSVPEDFFQRVHEAVWTKTDQPTTVRLGAFRNRLIILDFWATWCGGCLHSLNKLDSIGKAMKSDEFVVIPVTYEQASVAGPTWRRLDWDYLAIVRDSLLGQVFPTGGLPHQVWIKDGQVIAMPRMDYATGDNIARVLKGQDPASMMHMQVTAGAVDLDKQAFVDGNGETAHYHKSTNGVIAHYLPGYRRHRLVVNRVGDTTALLAVNQRLEALFYQAFKYRIFQPYAKRENPNNVVVEVGEDLADRFYPPKKSAGRTGLADDRLRTAWDSANLYGYQLWYPERISDTLARAMMQQDLNDFFGKHLGIEGRIEYRQHETYGVLRVLESIEHTKRALSRQAGPTYAYGQGRLFSAINSAVHNGSDIRVTTPLADSTGVAPDYLITADLPKAMRDGWALGRINRELMRYGLYVKLETKRVPVLVIRETAKKTDVNSD